MASLEVPRCASALSVVRLAPGQSLSGQCVGEGVPVMVHWSGSRSVPCTEVAGRCVLCERGNRAQWQGFFPILVGPGKVRMILLGSRSLATGQVFSVGAMVGRDCEFRRPKGRRFVEVSVGLFPHPIREFDALEAVAVLFGVVPWLPPCGLDRIERAYAARFADAPDTEVAS